MTRTRISSGSPGSWRLGERRARAARCRRRPSATRSRRRLPAKSSGQTSRAVRAVPETAQPQCCSRTGRGRSPIGATGHGANRLEYGPPSTSAAEVGARAADLDPVDPGRADARSRRPRLSPAPEAPRCRASTPAPPARHQRSSPAGRSGPRAPARCSGRGHGLAGRTHSRHRRCRSGSRPGRRGAGPTSCRPGIPGLESRPLASTRVPPWASTATSCARWWFSRRRFARALTATISVPGGALKRQNPFWPAVAKPRLLSSSRRSVPGQRFWVE